MSWRDQLNWYKVSNQSQNDLTSFFKDPGCWSWRGLNPRPPIRQTGALPTLETLRSDKDDANENVAEK